MSNLVRRSLSLLKYVNGKRLLASNISGRSSERLDKITWSEAIVLLLPAFISSVAWEEGDAWEPKANKRTNIAGHRPRDVAVDKIARLARDGGRRPPQGQSPDSNDRRGERPGQWQHTMAEEVGTRMREAGEAGRWRGHDVSRSPHSRRPCLRMQAPLHIRVEVAVQVSVQGRLETRWSRWCRVPKE